jgi:hypothetical protein
MCQTDPAYLTKVDDEGVPLMVQRVSFLRYPHVFAVELFDGSTTYMTPELICPGMLPGQWHLTYKQQAQAYRIADLMLRLFHTHERG